MELSVREWMIIIGVLLIVAVLLDGYRRVRNERRNRIRVSLSRQVFSQGAAQGADPDSPNPELPNGGARVRSKRPPPDLQLDEPVPVLMQSVHIGEPEPEPEPIDPEPLPLEPRAEQVARREAFEEDEDDWRPAAEMQRDIGDIDEPVGDERDEREDDWRRDDLELADDEEFFGEPAREAAARDAGFQPQQGAAATQEVMVIHVVCKDAQGFRGQDLLQILLACDLRFGRMNIFHRYEQANGRGPVQFSLANLVEPGSFDLDAMEEMRTPGVTLFLALPGPEKPITAFNYMVETAQVLVRNLHGELRDEAHSVMTAQTIEHCRQRIRDFERKQLTLQI